MAVEALTATGYPSIDAPHAPIKGVIHGIISRVEVTAGATNASTYTMARRLPSNAILIPTACKLWFDDLDNAGSPTLDLGIFGEQSQITDDDNALADGVDPTSAGSSVFLSTVGVFGQPLWDYVNAQTTDPDGTFAIKVTLQDAAASLGGTIALELAWMLG